MQVKTITFALVALVIGFVSGFALHPVVAPAAPVAKTAPLPALASTEPRATQYFEAHLDEAKAVVAGCTAGSVRGGECANAQNAVTEAEGSAQRRKFLGRKP